MQICTAAISAGLRSEPYYSGTVVPVLLNKWMTAEPLLDINPKPNIWKLVQVILISAGIIFIDFF